MILIVTNKRDITCDFIILELQRRTLPYFRLNTEDLPQGAFHWHPGGRWELQLDDVTLHLDDISAAYFRRPDPPEPLDFVAPAHSQYVSTEWQAALQAMYWALGDRWLNSPNQISLAENKIRQLTVANELGFLIPETLVGNSFQAAKEFTAPGGVVGKPLKRSVVADDGRESVIFTSRLASLTDEDEPSIRACPIIFQKEIPKAYDIRVTVVGSQVFSVTIDSQTTPDTEVDWRKTSSPDLEHLIYELPHLEAERCRQLTQALGLRYGAIDLVLDPDGQHWFLEINPNGQWGWIEVRTGHPIASAIVSELEVISRGI